MRYTSNSKRLALAMAFTLLFQASISWASNLISRSETSTHLIQSMVNEECQSHGYTNGPVLLITSPANSSGQSLCQGMNQCHTFSTTKITPLSQVLHRSGAQHSNPDKTLIGPILSPRVPYSSFQSRAGVRFPRIRLMIRLRLALRAERRERMARLLEGH